MNIQRLQTRRVLPRALLTACFLTLAAGPGGGAVALSAQAGPPPAGEPVPPTLPAPEETTLSSGVRLVLLPDPGPRLHLELILPGGSASDPEGAPGTAALLAQLLGEGTTARSAVDLQLAFDRLGVYFRAGSTPDHLSLVLRVGVDEAEEALALLGEILRDPALPEGSLARAREGLAEALREGRSSDGRVASEAFSAALYGDHPWGRILTPEDVEAVSRDALLDYHARVVRPGNALLVATGPVELEALRSRLEVAFQGWEGTGVPLPDVSGATNPAATEIVVVDRPGLNQAVIVGGLLLPETDAAEWAALRVAERILGGGPGSRLAGSLRDDRGYTASVESAVVRRRGGGLLQVAARLRPDATGAGVAELLNQIVILRDRPVPAGELETARQGALGALTLQLETPDQRLDRAVQDLLQGRAADAVEELALRIPRVTAEELQRVFRATVNPGEMLFVAVGNAAVLREQLSPLGVVRVLDNPLADLLVSLAPPMPGESSFLRTDGSELEPLEAAYTVYADARPVGSVTRTLDTIPGGLLRFRSEAELGGQEVIQSVTVRREGLRFVESTTEVRAGGRVQRGEIRREGNRIVGVQDTPNGPIEVDIVAGADVLVSDMVELILWTAELEPGMTRRIPMANLRTGRVETATLSVGSPRVLSLPVGEVEAYPVELSGPERQTFWVRVEEPHLVVLTELASPPLEIALDEVRPSPGGEVGSGPGSSSGGGF